MRSQRPLAKAGQLSNGPAKLCAALDISRRLDGVDLSALSSELIIARNPGVREFVRARGKLVTTTRIGLSVAADLPLRFYLEGSDCVSKRVRRPD